MSSATASPRLNCRARIISFRSPAARRSAPSRSGPSCSGRCSRLLPLSLLWGGGATPISPFTTICSAPFSPMTRRDAERLRGPPRRGARRARPRRQPPVARSDLVRGQDARPAVAAGAARAARLDRRGACERSRRAFPGAPPGRMPTPTRRRQARGRRPERDRRPDPPPRRAPSRRRARRLPAAPAKPRLGRRQGESLSRRAAISRHECRRPRGRRRQSRPRRLGAARPDRLLARPRRARPTRGAGGASRPTRKASPRASAPSSPGPASPSTTRRPGDAKGGVRRPVHSADGRPRRAGLRQGGRARGARSRARRSAARLMPFMPVREPLLGEASVSSPFGYRPDPFLGRPALHPGVDLVQAYGSEIRATAAGRVVHAGWMGGYGDMVEIDHGNGLATRYGHMSEVLVSEGDEVKAGDGARPHRLDRPLDRPAPALRSARRRRAGRPRAVSARGRRLDFSAGIDYSRRAVPPNAPAPPYSGAMELLIWRTLALLGVAMAVAILARRLRLPYTVGLVLTGLGLALAHIDIGIALTHEVIFERHSAAAPVRGRAQPALERAEARPRAGDDHSEPRRRALRRDRRGRAGLWAGLADRSGARLRIVDRGNRSDLGHRAVARDGRERAARAADRKRKPDQRRRRRRIVRAGRCDDGERRAADRERGRHQVSGCGRGRRGHRPRHRRRRDAGGGRHRRPSDRNRADRDRGLWLVPDGGAFRGLGGARHRGRGHADGQCRRARGRRASFRADFARARVCHGLLGILPPFSPIRSSS